MRVACEYAIVRVVPDLVRGEFVNCGVAGYCAAKGELLAEVHLDEHRLRSIDKSVDLAAVRRHLKSLCRICRGDEQAGPIGKMSAAERWRWVVAPRSTILQLSAPHSAMTDSLPALVERLMTRVVHTQD